MLTFNSPNFSNLVIGPFGEWSESQPKLATSYSQKNSNKHNLGIWGFGGLSIYLEKTDYLNSIILTSYKS